jgi:hypothetical protein
MKKEHENGVVVDAMVEKQVSVLSDTLIILFNK